MSCVMPFAIALNRECLMVTGIEVLVFQIVVVTSGWIGRLYFCYERIEVEVASHDVLGGILLWIFLHFKFVTRLKTGGKSTTQKNYLTLTVPSDGTLKVYARTGKNSETNRNIKLTQDGTQLIDKILLESEAVKATVEGETEQKSVYPAVSVAVKKGDVVITYPTNSVNIYGIELATATGVSSVSVTEAKAKTATFNLAGQQVSESYKGIVVKNGKKYLNK